MEKAERAAPTPRVNDLREMTRSGRLPVGTVLVHKGRGTEGDVEAMVVADGLRLRGKVYPSVSTAARAVAMHSVNGWKYWRLRSGELLSSLRTR